jgi:hypothetical protein
MEEKPVNEFYLIHAKISANSVSSALALPLENGNKRKARETHPEPDG